MRLCFDLDKTLCEGEYENAKLISGVKETLKSLKDDGHTIILYTARGMGTNAGNVGGAISKIGLLTLTHLAEWGLVFDEIYFGKPSADYYIDDKSIDSVTALLERIQCQKQDLVAKQSAIASDT